MLIDFFLFLFCLFIDPLNVMDHLSREKEKFASVIGETGSFGTLFFVFSSSG